MITHLITYVRSATVLQIETRTITSYVRTFTGRGGWWWRCRTVDGVVMWCVEIVASRQVSAHTLHCSSRRATTTATDH